VPPLDVWYPEIILVVEGAARSVADQAPGRPPGQAPDQAPDQAPGRAPGEAPGRAEQAPRSPVAGSVRVVAAPGSGDDTIAQLAAQSRGNRLVVTADRELRRRSEAAGATVTGPRWLLDML
jgi:8-oxo-dGTP diphosphatase